MDSPIRAAALAVAGLGAGEREDTVRVAWRQHVEAIAMHGRRLGPGWVRTQCARITEWCARLGSRPRAEGGVVHVVRRPCGCGKGRVA